MNILDVYDAQAIAYRMKEVESNRLPYIGEGFFPPEKKMGLDLKGIRVHRGLGVELMPSNFDAEPVLRGRQGFALTETQMAFFREAMVIKEEDEQTLMRVRESSEPYLQEVLRNIYRDTEVLVEGARIVAERMRMQLLCPNLPNPTTSTVDGSPRISIEANGVLYSYEYDVDGSYRENNYKELSAATDKWNDADNSDPIEDVRNAQDEVEIRTGVRPSVMLISKQTMKWLTQNKKIRGVVLAQNLTPNIYMTDNRVNEVFQSVLGVSIVVVSKLYQGTDGTAHQYYADGYATLVPPRPLGRTWYGTTPEERTAIGNPAANVSMVDTGIAVAVSQTRTTPPWNTQTTVSEILLPSYEDMDLTYVIKVA